MAKASSERPAPDPRKGMPSPRLDEAAFRARFAEALHARRAGRLPRIGAALGEPREK